MPKSRKRKPDKGRPRQGRTAAPAEKALLLYHDMAVYENFERCSYRLVEMLQHAQHQYPGKPRRLLLEVQGHRNDEGGFDHDAWEVIRYLVMEKLFPYFTQVTTPLHVIENPRPQRNDVPDAIQIGYPENDDGFWYDIELLPVRHREAISADRRTPPSLKAIGDYLGMDPVCLVCWGVPAERAHVVPVSLGGSMDVRNFALLCEEHHRQAPDIADAEAFWAWVDYAEMRDSGSKWSRASAEVKEWVQAQGGRTEPADWSEEEFLAAVRHELKHLYCWSDTDFAAMSWELLQEYHQVLDAATGKHFGVERKVATHAWAYHMARRRLVKRAGAGADEMRTADHPWSGAKPTARGT